MNCAFWKYEKVLFLDTLIHNAVDVVILKYFILFDPEQTGARPKSSAHEESSNSENQSNQENYKSQNQGSQSQNQEIQASQSQNQEIHQANQSQLVGPAREFGVTRLGAVQQQGESHWQQLSESADRSAVSVGPVIEAASDAASALGKPLIIGLGGRISSWEGGSHGSMGRIKSWI